MATCKLQPQRTNSFSPSIQRLPPLAVCLLPPRSPSHGAGSPRKAVVSGAAATLTAPTSPLSTFVSPKSEEPEAFLARYALGAPLGQGTYGTVHSAVNRATGEEVAVKVLPKQHAASRNQRSALHREATLWKRACAASRQACRFLSVEEDAGNYYIVQEKCDGGSLQDLLEKRGVLSEAELSQVAWCVLSFLSDLHKGSIYYGDLKPGNVILKDVYPCGSEGGCLNVRVVDFGCSQLVVPGTPLRGMSGSPLFVAPEIIGGAYGLPADMWAFGVMLYTLICARLPFWLEPVSDLEELDLDSIYASIRYSPVLFAGKLWKGVSEELKDLVCGLLEKDPSRRLSAEAALEHPWFAQAREMCEVA